MPKRRFIQADVFSAMPTLGNGLAVVVNAEGMSDDEMQIFAAWTNLAEVFPDETHLYAASLDDPNLYRPTAHIFWSERLPWIELSDDLPKHEKGLQHAAQSGSKFLK